MTETGKMKILRFVLKAVVIIARQLQPLTPEVADIINEGNKLVGELEK